MNDQKRTGKNEAELLAKLEQWLTARDDEPTIFDVLASGDIDLFGAYVLRQARAATRQAALENVWLEAGYEVTGEHRTARLVAAFAALTARWNLSFDEKLHLLGLKDSVELDKLLALPLSEVPISIIERISTLFRISQSIRTLLPEQAIADEWVKLPSSAPMFGGRSALDLMLANGLDGIRQVSKYLLAQIWST